MGRRVFRWAGGGAWPRASVPRWTYSVASLRDPYWWADDRVPAYLCALLFFLSAASAGAWRRHRDLEGGHFSPIWIPPESIPLWRGPRETDRASSLRPGRRVSYPVKKWESTDVSLDRNGPGTVLGGRHFMGPLFTFFVEGGHGVEKWVMAGRTSRPVFHAGTRWPGHSSPFKRFGPSAWSHPNLLESRPIIASLLGRWTFEHSRPPCLPLFRVLVSAWLPAHRFVNLQASPNPIGLPLGGGIATPSPRPVGLDPRPG